MGNAVTIADFELYDALVWHNELDDKLIAKYGNLMEYLTRFQNLPKIKSFLNCPYYMKNFFPPFACFGGNRKQIEINLIFFLICKMRKLRARLRDSKAVSSVLFTNKKKKKKFQNLKKSFKNKVD